MNDNDEDRNFQRSNRKLKKIYNRVRKQMEFYFSDSNLAKDKFLVDLIAKDVDGFVEIDVFQNFNKIKAITNSSEIIAESLSKSDLFEVSADRKKIRRIAPLNLAKDFDACTLYVEKLPLNADPKWVKDVLGQFGTITYINVPRFKASNRIKGFAFVEFESPESVKKACEFYRIASEKECTASEDEDKSVKHAKKHKHEENVSEKKNKKGRNRSVSESSDKVPDFSGIKNEQNQEHSEKNSAKKHKHEENVSEKRSKKSRARSVSESSDKMPDFSPVKKEQNQESSEKNSDLHPRNKRKRKRCCSESEIVLKKIKESTDKISSASETKELPNESVVASNIKVSSNSETADCDVKTEPNSQTEEQTVTSEVKVEVPNTCENGTGTEVAEVVKSKRRRKNSKRHRSHAEKPILRVMPKSEWKAYRSKYLDLQRSTMKLLKKQILNELQEFKEQESNLKPVDSHETKKSSLQFVPGIIIKVKLNEPVKNPSDIKTQVKANALVAYVDAPVDCSEMFIRCHNSEDAQNILKDKKLSHIGVAQLIEGEEEKKYWEKIESDRKNKLSNPVIKKKRGRDKLIAKAAKLEEIKNKHIYFDE